MTLIRDIRHEALMAYRRLRIRRTSFNSGLGNGAHLLAGLVRSLRPETCVEIGSANGLSTCHIALALEQNLKGTLWAIDPHNSNDWNDRNSLGTLENIKANLQKIGRPVKRVNIIQKTTEEAVKDIPDKIDFAFIDGDHSYEGVKKDWEIVYPRMTSFGVVVFHDTIWDVMKDDASYNSERRSGMGVPKLVEKIRNEGFPVITLSNDWGFTLVQATKGGHSLV